MNCMHRDAWFQSERCWIVSSLEDSYCLSLSSVWFSPPPVIRREENEEKKGKGSGGESKEGGGGE